MGLRIFLHAMRLVFSQLGAALRISGVLYIISSVISGFAYFSVFGGVANPTQLPANSWQFFAATLISVLIYLWIAVGWHRFVLLDEAPATPLPPFHGDRVLAYFGRLLQLGLLGLAVGVLIGLSSFALASLSGGNVVILSVVPLVLLAVMLLIFYRLAPVLPGAAVGKPIGIGAAWKATSGAWGTFLVLAVVCLIASLVIDLPAFAVSYLMAGTAGALLSLIWVSITAWIKLMAGISILTAIYGVYVEKRAIA